MRLSARFRGFLADAGERAAKTALQYEAATLAVQGVTVLDIDWRLNLAAAGTAAVASLVTSFLSYDFGPTGTASLTSAVVPAVDTPKGT